MTPTDHMYFRSLDFLDTQTLNRYDVRSLPRAKSIRLDVCPQEKITELSFGTLHHSSIYIHLTSLSPEIREVTGGLASREAWDDGA